MHAVAAAPVHTGCRCVPHGMQMSWQSPNTLSSGGMTEKRMLGTTELKGWVLRVEG